MAIDAVAGALIGGVADAGAADAAVAVGADVGAGAAVDAGAAAADVGAGFGAAGPALAETITPEVAGGAATGLEAANAEFGTFSPDLFAANTADVAAGGLGTDVGALGADVGSVAGADVGGVAGADAGGFFGGDLSGGVGDFGGGFSSADIGGVDAAGNPIASGVQGTQGSWAGYAPGVGENVPGAQGFGAATEQQTPLYSTDAGIVDPGPTLENTMGTPSAVTPGGGGLQNASIQAGGVPDISGLDTSYPQGVINSDFSNFPNAGTIANPPSELGPQFANPSDLAMTGPTTPSQLATMQQVGVPATAATDPFGTGPVAADTSTLPSETAVANAYPGAAPTLPSGQEVGPGVVGAPAQPPAAALPPGTTPGPGTVGTPPATTAATPASPAAAAAGGGTDALTALRMGAAGASIVSSGLNIANALNQPSYSALQPIYYPGSTAATTPFNPTPNAQGFPVDNTGGGGIAGGLAATRLTNGLLAGQSAQQLALAGLISPARATRLQSTYSGITDQYAQQLGVDPRTLSPGVKQMIAARALADSGLGGR
jgi:hypothetical protein